MYESKFVILNVLWFILHQVCPTAYRHKWQFIGFSWGISFHFFLCLQVASTFFSFLTYSPFEGKNQHFLMWKSYWEIGEEIGRLVSSLRFFEIAKSQALCHNQNQIPPAVLNSVFLRHILVQLAMSSKIFLDYPNWSNLAVLRRRW